MEQVGEVVIVLVEYRTVAKEAETLLVEKKSKFIAKVRPVKSAEEAEAFIEEVRKEHWNATHNVPAYIIGINKEVQKFSDDNEPSGTAGLPILEILKSHDVVDTAVVVTRYFGGTLLGRGGLIRAYGGAAKQVLTEAGIVRMVPAQQVAMTVDYGLSGKVQNELHTKNISITDTEYLADVTFHLELLYDQQEAVFKMIQEITADQFKWVERDHVYQAVHVEI